MGPPGALTRQVARTLGNRHNDRSECLWLHGQSRVIAPGDLKPDEAAWEARRGFSPTLRRRLRRTSAGTDATFPARGTTAFDPADVSRMERNDVPNDRGPLAPSAPTVRN